MSTFKCQSCGSTSVIQKNAQNICAYCHSNVIKDVHQNPSKNIILYGFSIAIVTVTIVLIYTLVNGSTVKQESPTSHHIKKADNGDAPKSALSSSSIKDLNPSSIQESTFKKHSNALTPWLSKREYQSRFDSGYYKQNSTYPAYVELDDLGNRRVLEISEEAKFYWAITSGRLYKEFQKQHVKHIMNGKRLLSLSIKMKEGIALYTGTWISNTQFDRESKKLQAYGIYPPKLK